MIPTVSVAQMREVDRLAVEVAGVTLMQMMENAGRALAEVVRRTCGGDLRGRCVVVLAGTGGNGGGGLVAARRMAGWGAGVDVVLTGRPADLTGVPAHQHRALAMTGVRVHAEPERSSRCAEADVVAEAIAAADVIVDALVGYSLTGAPRGTVRELVEASNAASAPVVSLDVPSGLDPDTGQPALPTARADATLALALPKTGLLGQAARPHVGDLYLADIGVPPEVFRRVGVEVGDLFAVADIIRLG